MSNPRVSNSRLAIVVGLILTAGLCVEVSARTVSIEVDSRKGVGLIPAFWRGVALPGCRAAGLSVMCFYCEVL